MIERIKNELEQVEKKEQITVHFACESGSRAWGFPSPDSDYDVRFIYSRPVNWYLSIERNSDFIDLPIFDNLDINGWDIKKALVLLYGSNSVIYEWLQSPIVYCSNGSFRDDLFKLAEEYFSPRTALHHYLGLCKKSILSKIQDEEVIIKKYFYILRPLLAALWITRYNSVPPMEFRHLLKLIEERNSVINPIRDLLERKKTAAEAEKIPVIPALQTFIDEEYNRCKLHAEQLTVEKRNAEKLNDFFRRIVKE
jgi:predicted nucleotidyltransferase